MLFSAAILDEDHEAIHIISDLRELTVLLGTTPRRVYGPANRSPYGTEPRGDLAAIFIWTSHVLHIDVILSLPTRGHLLDYNAS